MTRKVCEWENTTHLYNVDPSISWAETVAPLPCSWCLAPVGLDTLVLLVASSSGSLAPRGSHTDTNRPYGVSGSWPGPSGASCSLLLL